MAFWRRRTGVRYAVSLHLTGLKLRDPHGGSPRVGGVYAWRFVRAADRDEAADKALDDLLRDPMFTAEAGKPDKADLNVTAMEVLDLSRHNEFRTTMVFYIETEDETEQ